MLVEMGTFLTNYTCCVVPGRRLLSMTGAPLPGTGATSAGSTPRARTDRRTRRALPRSEGRSRRGGMTLVAGTGHPSNPPGRRGAIRVAPRWGSRRPPPDAEHE